MMLMWRFPLNSRKAHVFAEDDARSLCGRWMFTGEGQGEFDPSKKIGPDDCVACDRKARKLTLRKQQ